MFLVQTGGSHQYLYSLKAMMHYATLLPATNVARNIVTWNRTAFYSRNNVARNKVASNSHNTLRGFVASNSCAQQSCLVYHGLKQPSFQPLNQPKWRTQGSSNKSPLRLLTSCSTVPSPVHPIISRCGEGQLLDYTTSPATYSVHDNHD